MSTLSWAAHRDVPNTLSASPSLVVWATPGTLRPFGNLVEHNFETTIKQSSNVLELKLDGDRWAPEVAHIECDACPEDRSLPGSQGGARVMTPAVLPPGCPCLAGDPSARTSWPLCSLLVVELELLRSRQPITRSPLAD